MKRLAWCVAGVLSVLVFSVGASSGGRAASAGGTKTFRLAATSAAWVNTRIRIPVSGAKVTVAGNAKCGPGTDCPAGSPLGAGHTCGARALGALNPGPAPDTNYGAVAGRLDPSGKPFMIGASKTVKGPGILYLVYEDCAGYYGDNSGTFNVTVEVSAENTIEGKAYRLVCSETACHEAAPFGPVTVGRDLGHRLGVGRHRRRGEVRAEVARERNLAGGAEGRGDSSVVSQAPGR